MPQHTAARRASAAAAVVLLAALAGCAGVPQQPVPAAVEAEAPAAPAPASVEPAPAPAAAPVARAARKPAPRPRDVLVLHQDGAGGYAAVAAAIVESLPPERYRTTSVAVTPNSGSEIAALAERGDLLVVAVGLAAVEAARAQLPTRPLVFCQVFNYRPLLEAGRPVWGVDSLPPLALQLRAWQSLTPAQGRIGVIVSDARPDLADAMAAAAPTLEVDSAVSASDRETLYLFKRLAEHVDGFWLLPDNRILSTRVLRELLDYAVAHRVGVLVQSEALLPWGALLSTTSTAADVAARVHEVLDRVAAGATRELAPLTPLTEVEVRVNPTVAAALGVADAPAEPWVLREPD